MRQIWIALVIVLMLVVVILLVRSRSSDDMQVVDVVEETQPIPLSDPQTDSVATEENVDVDATIERPDPVIVEREDEGLRELDESDQGLKSELKSMSSHPFWAQIDDGKHLIRKAVAATDLVRRQKNPFSQLFFMGLSGAFEVEERNGVITIAEANHDRYAGLVTALHALDADRVSALVKRYEPLIEEAYGELGNNDASWRETLLGALDEIIDATIPLSSPELAGREGVYIFKDPDIEARSPIEKLLIRMGYDNARECQRFASQLRKSL